MAIDINKPGDGGGNSSGPDYNDPNSSPEVREMFRFAYECKQKNMPDYQIEQSLMNQGLDAAQVASVMRIVNQAYTQRTQAPAPEQSSGGRGVPSIVWYIGILLLINLLSAIFDWGFWIY